MAKDKVNDVASPLPDADGGSDDRDCIDETAFLLSSALNAARLKQAILDLEAGRGIEHGLIQ